MMRLLDASNADDAATWRSLVDSLPPASRDLHYLPGYVDLYARRRGGVARCFVDDDGLGFALYPFVDLGTSIACTYGYGGPLASEGYDEGRFFDARFQKLMRERGVQSEFCRLHPLMMDAHKSLLNGTKLVAEKRVVCIGLDAGDPREGMRKGHRAAEARARREGVVVKRDDDLTGFVAMYADAMGRKDAEQKWAVDENMAMALISAAMGGAAIFTAYYKGEPEAACFLLFAFGTCYYHYAASYDRHRHIGIGTLLVLEAARWAKARGMRWFYMGGGLSAAHDDPLLRFKEGFTPDRRLLYKYERGF